MNISTFVFNDLYIGQSDLETFMGYQPDSDSPFSEEDFQDAINKAIPVMQIRTGYMRFNEVQHYLGDASLSIGNVHFYTGKIIQRRLMGISGAVLFVCTAGEGIADLVKSSASSGDLLTSYLYDIIGTLTVEKAADKMQKMMEAELGSEGYRTTLRYSPGYCGWDVAEQQKLFSLLPPDVCGVRLSPSSLMHPIKSVSGIIGFGMNIKQLQYHCDSCSFSECFPNRRNS
jgi:hypothetical protein